MFPLKTAFGDGFRTCALASEAQTLTTFTNTLRTLPRKLRGPVGPFHNCWFCSTRCCCGCAMNRMILFFLIPALGACGSGSTGSSDKTPTGTEDMAVTLTRAPGTSTLLFSASVRVGNGSSFRVTDRDEHTVSGLTTGTHLVEATNPTSNCVIQGASSKSVSIVANQVTEVTFQKSCTSQPQLIRPHLRFHLEC